MSRTPDQIVSSEVHYCVSYLVSTLAKSSGGMLSARSGGNPYLDESIRDTVEMAEQAFELCSPILDYEEAAFQAGFKFYPESGLWHAIDQAEDPDESMVINFDGAEEVCREQDIEPYEREVFEHWIVSDWLADKLIEKGEKVDKDFAGMIVWARTTSGQGIASDSVIEAIAADLAR